MEANSSDVVSDFELDVTGLICPEPVMMLHGKIRELALGQTLAITATDPSTERDIPKFCQFLGHELLKQSSDDQHFFYLIKKAAD